MKIKKAKKTGYNAHILRGLCKVYIDARKEKALLKTQTRFCRYSRIPITEYEHLKRCKEELIALHEAEIANLRNQMQTEAISSIVNIYTNKC